MDLSIDAKELARELVKRAVDPDPAENPTIPVQPNQTPVGIGLFRTSTRRTPSERGGITPENPIAHLSTWELAGNLGSMIAGGTLGGWGARRAARGLGVTSRGALGRFSHAGGLAGAGLATGVLEYLDQWGINPFGRNEGGFDPAHYEAATRSVTSREGQRAGYISSMAELTSGAPWLTGGTLDYFGSFLPRGSGVRHTLSGWARGLRHASNWLTRAGRNAGLIAHHNAPSNPVGRFVASVRGFLDRPSAVLFSPLAHLNAAFPGISGAPDRQINIPTPGGGSMTYRETRDPVGEEQAELMARFNASSSGRRMSSNIAERVLAGNLHNIASLPGREEARYLAASLRATSGNQLTPEERRVLSERGPYMAQARPLTHNLATGMQLAAEELLGMQRRGVPLTADTFVQSLDQAGNPIAYIGARSLLASANDASFGAQPGSANNPVVQAALPYVNMIRSMPESERRRLDQMLAPRTALLDNQVQDWQRREQIYRDYIDPSSFWSDQVDDSADAYARQPESMEDFAARAERYYSGRYDPNINRNEDIARLISERSYLRAHDPVGYLQTVAPIQGRAALDRLTRIQLDNYGDRTLLDDPGLAYIINDPVLRRVYEYQHSGQAQAGERLQLSAEEEAHLNAIMGQPGIADSPAIHALLGGGIVADNPEYRIFFDNPRLRYVLEEGGQPEDTDPNTGAYYVTPQGERTWVTMEERQILDRLRNDPLVQQAASTGDWTILATVDQWREALEGAERLRNDIIQGITGEDNEVAAMGAWQEMRRNPLVFELVPHGLSAMIDQVVSDVGSRQQSLFDQMIWSRKGIQEYNASQPVDRRIHLGGTFYQSGYQTPSQDPAGYGPETWQRIVRMSGDTSTPLPSTPPTGDSFVGGMLWNRILPSFLRGGHASDLSYFSVDAPTQGIADTQERQVMGMGRAYQVARAARQIYRADPMFRRWVEAARANPNHPHHDLARTIFRYVQAGERLDRHDALFASRH